MLLLCCYYISIALLLCYSCGISMRWVLCYYIIIAWSVFAYYL